MKEIIKIRTEINEPQLNKLCSLYKESMKQKAGSLKR
jgi:hypothetical protein